MTFFFLKRDYDLLNEQINNACDEIKKAGQEMGKSCEEGAETYHDNFAYEQGERDQNRWSGTLRRLLSVRNSARVILPEENTGEVRIGRLVTIQDQDSGEKKTFWVGSYMVLQKIGEHETPILSYDTPLVRSLLGAREGDEREFVFHKKRYHYEIIKIE